MKLLQRVQVRSEKGSEMSKRVLLLTCAVTALSGLAGVTGAQAQAAAAAADQTSTVGEVIVTAEKRSVSVQKVPVAVTAFTAKQRNLEGITTIQDITNFTPGLTYSSQLDRAALRGLSRLTNILAADASVAVYIDDLYTTSTFLVGIDDMINAQVEIERGPQGTLYGRNAIGGLINTISKRPTDDFSGEIRAGYGNYDASKIEATVSGPTGIPNLDFRLSGVSQNQNDGYFTNLAAGKPQEGGIVHDWYGFFQLEYKPTDRDDIWAEYIDLGFEGDRGGPGSLLGTPEKGAFDTSEANFDTSNLTFNPNFGYSTACATAATCFSPLGFANGPVPGSVVGQVGTSNPALSNIRNFAKTDPTSIHLHDSWSINFHWTHHFDGFDVKYVGGYNQYHYNLHQGLFYGDNSPISSYQVPVAPGSYCDKFGAACPPLTVYPDEDFNYRENNSWFSHELTFSSTSNGPLQWIAGFYYYNENYHDPITVSLPQQAQVKKPLFGLSVTDQVIGTAANPSGDWYYTSYELETKSTAVYGQVDWKATDTIKLTAGLRYTYDQKQGIEDYRIINFSNALANPLGFGTAAELSAENLGAGLPAVDITPIAIGGSGTPGSPNYVPGPLNTSYKGVTCLPHLIPNGQYERCLGDTSSATTGTAGIEFTPDRNTLAYIRYNRGYKAFGLNAGTMVPNPEALPETVDDVEVGLKQSIGPTFQYNIDFFYYNYMNDQVPIGVNNGALISTEFENIPQSTSSGVELQMIWDPIRHLDLNFTYAFDDTFIDSNCTAKNGVATGTCFVDVLDPLALAAGAKGVGAAIPHAIDYPFAIGPNGLQGAISGSVQQSVKGQELPQAPKNKIAFNANYTWEFEPGNFTLSGTYVWRDKSYAAIFTRSYYEAPSWNQVDVRGTWSGDHDHYEIVVYVRNLFNTLGYDAAGGATAGYTGNPTNPLFTQTAYDLTPPRTYGVEVHYKF
jgi:iron complex outermembrane receptor protein